MNEGGSKCENLPILQYQIRNGIDEWDAILVGNEILRCML